MNEQHPDQESLPIDWPDATVDQPSDELKHLANVLNGLQASNATLFNALQSAAQGQRTVAPHVLAEAKIDALIQVLGLSEEDRMRIAIIFEQTMTGVLRQCLTEVAGQGLIVAQHAHPEGLGNAKAPGPSGLILP